MILTDDKILLKVHREWSKDEATKLLLQEVSNLKIKIGELTSEKHELEDTIKEIEKDKIEFKKDKEYNRLKNEANKAAIELGRARKDARLWQEKYLATLIK